MPFEEARDASPMVVTPRWGKVALGTWRFQGGISDTAPRENRPSKQERVCEQTGVSGVYVCQHLSFDTRWEGAQRIAKVRTGLGKTRRPGS